MIKLERNPLHPIGEPFGRGASPEKHDLKMTQRQKVHTSVKRKGDR